MSEDLNKKTPLRFVALKIAIACAVVTAIGLSVGTLLGILQDFGITYTAENMRLNPGSLAKQYAGR